MKDHQSISRKETEAFVDFVIEEARRLIHLAESTDHFTRFPHTKIDCGDYFKSQIDKLLEQAYNEYVPFPVSLKLEQLLNDVGYYMTCCEFPGVSRRCLKINPMLEYFDCAYDLYEDPEIRPLLFNSRYNPQVIVTDQRLAKRNEYFARKRQEFEEAGIEFSVEKAFYKEANDTFELMISQIRERIDSLLEKFFNELNTNLFYEMKDHFTKMNIEEFRNYCPTDDLIDPRTGNKAFDKSMSVMDRYEYYRKLSCEIGYDADSSYEAMVIAQLVFPFASREYGWYIAEQDGIIETKYGKEINISPYGLKYELRNNKYDFTLCGDTMNSAATTLKACSHLIDGDDELEQLRDEFIKKYHTFGNFILLPYRKGVSVNSARGIGKAKDYFDLFLTAVRKGTTEDILNDKAALLMLEYMDKTIGLNGDRKMRGFLHLNLLESCIAYNRGYKLWEGHDLENVYPETKEQVKEFFTNAIRMIEIRSEKIYKKLVRDRIIKESEDE